MAYPGSNVVLQKGILKSIRKEELLINPTIINQFTYHDRRFDFITGSYTFQVTFDEGQRLFEIHDENLNIYVFAKTRDELLSDLYEQLFVLYTEYALASDNEITEEAKKLKQTLLKTLKETTN
jgi:hypothetical protein